MGPLSYRWGVYAPPRSNEEQFLNALERHFPGATYQPPPASTAPTPSPSSTSGVGTIPPEGGAGAVLSHRLSMLAVLDQALAFGAHGEQGKTPPDPPAELYDYAFIGSSKIDGPKIQKWIRSLPQGATIVMCEPRWRKDGGLMNSEAFVANVVLDESKIFVPELRKDLYGDKARDCQVEAVCNAAKTIVLFGTGSRVTAAKNWAKRFAGKYAPTIIEIGAK